MLLFGSTSEIKTKQGDNKDSQNKEQSVSKMLGLQMRRLTTMHGNGMMNRLQHQRKNTVVAQELNNDDNNDSDVAYGPDAMFGKKTSSDLTHSEDLSDFDIKRINSGSMGAQMNSMRGNSVLSRSSSSNLRTRISNNLPQRL